MRCPMGIPSRTHTTAGSSPGFSIGTSTEASSLARESGSTSSSSILTPVPETTYRFLFAPSAAGSKTTFPPFSSEILRILTPCPPSAQDEALGETAVLPPNVPQTTFTEQPSPSTTGMSQRQTVFTEFSPFFISSGRLIMICVMSLGFLSSWFARGYISSCWYFDEAQTHWTSPNPNLPSMPSVSKWSM